MRDDPYYIVDNSAPRPPVEDIDSIPVVRLDDLPPMPKGKCLFIKIKKLNLVFIYLFILAFR